MADLVADVGLECIRDELAPLAMHAYPEAYSEFQQCMLLFAYQEAHMGSPVESMWALDTRDELAGLLCRTMRQAAGAPATHPSDRPAA